MTAIPVETSNPDATFPQPLPKATANPAVPPPVVSDGGLVDEQLRQSYVELQAIYRMVESVARAGELETIYSAALDELQETIKADRASILLFDADGVMRFKAWRGLSEEYRRAVEGHSPWKVGARDPQPIVVADVGQDEELRTYGDLFAREGIAALAFIPLVDAGELLGKFMLYFNQPLKLEPVKTRLAQTIASHIAFAIVRKRSETALRESEERNRVLADAGAILNSSLDYALTLQSITQLAVPAMADWCLVDVVDGNGGFERIAAVSANEMDVSVASGLRRRYADIEGSPHGVTRVVNTGQPELMMQVNDEVLRTLARDDEHLELIRAMQMTSYMCVPLVTRGRTIGAVSFAVGPSGRRYGSGDLPLAEELTRRAAIAVDNARLYREAQEANRAKSQFLAMMSHELRTPLNAIGGYTELLQLGVRGPVTELQHADLSRIQRSQQHLLGLINDLLQFARIESGHVELQLERLGVADVVEGLHALIQPQLTSRRLQLDQQEIAADLVCVADRDKLRQVLLNLLSNAVKFTPEGGRITLACESDGSHIRISVTDTGPGIPQEKFESIFEPFVQLANAPSRISDGAGLGLAISRELARAMGGDITVRNREGTGAEFVCHLPREAASAT